MARKKTKDSKAKKPKKAGKKKKAKVKAKGKRTKKQTPTGDDLGIIVIDDDLAVDKNAELEARKAYLEEARSQEAFD